MAAPLHSSSGHNAAAGGGAKTIEEMYQKKTQLEHILLRPDTYIGSVEKHTQALWIYEDGAMVNRSVTYVPGLYKIFDEILVNAADNKQRDPKMDALRVEIDVDSCCISVYNNGDGIPVEVHQEEGVYVPEMILGHLLTSSNYNDNEKKTTGGRNGYGAKLTNIFSTEFVIETADGRRQKKYKQVFYENMGKKSEPQITKCKQGENWTRVTFKPDLAKFNMTHLEDDVVALMRKRVVDMAGTLGKTVKVELDGQRVPIKSFCDYVDLYMKSANCDRPDNFKRIYEQVNDRWEVCVSQSEGQFQQVSFVNRIATIRGGSHVDYVTNQIANHVVAIVNKKNKNANMKLHNVKSHLWVFVNALIDNPAFDSQTKETLTTRQGSFGSKCELSSDFLKKVEKSGVIENVLSWADFKLSKELKKTDGSKKSRISGIPKLEDANEAGGKDSDKCTLILTEGDSAKALAMSGIAVVGRDYYGVFPLRGKLLNVREANHKQIMDNAEIQHIKQILGLQHGKQYESTKGLRYGHLMIMTDQDHDGSHIKGLLINFIHSFWPSLLKVPSFLVEFITPIIKATRGQTTKSFYTMPEYEEWRKNLGASASSWTIKYYKGLGTSTAKEGRKYFEDIIDHKKDFVWVDDQDGNHIELAFSKKRIADRKQWLTNFQPGTYIDQREKQVKYSDFINKELILFSMADLQRSIPSMVDGLKPGQRKILFCSFKRNFVKEAKVAQFSGYVSEHSAYHHGEQSLASTIIGMAQNFVGSNNINLMSPNGQFGTRAQGGKDAASPRYIFTKLSNITRSIFPKDDDILLNYLNEDGQSIEPTWYMPILPMVLVNGSEGIGTGWSTYIPNYNPRDIVANVRRLLNEESTVPMHPWYRGFKGSIEKTVNTKVAGSTYTVTGIIEVVDNTTLRITELPIRRWTQDYKDFLESLAPDPKNKDKVTFIEDVTSQGDNEDVYIQLKLSEANVNVAKEEGLVKKFKLTTTIGTTNMHLFDSDGKIRKYDTPEQILEEFFQLRLEFYCKRKEALLKNIKLDLKKLENKVRFIRCVVDNEIIVNNRKRADLFLELRHKNFDPF
ncbi:DNA topoisomerase 2, partial [Zea mays]